MNRKIFPLLIIISLFLTSACAKTTPAPSGDFSSADLGISINDKTYHLREDSAGLISALGDDFAYSEVVSCVYDGKDKTYAYENITVSTVPVDGKDIIEMITLTAKGYKTLRSVEVGMSKEDIISAYGEKYFDDGYITYSLTNDPSDIQSERIQFEMSGGVIGKIYIYSPSY